MAALKMAAAILETRPRPTSRSFKHASAWVLLTKVTPELENWSNYFAAGSAKRKAAEAGITRFISAQDADDMVRQTAAFLEIAESMVGA
ncbi:hypothetical protein EH165_05305 [Nakamurella antarctica]|uniref:SAV-6107-like HEPN domain-containing protein n=1 Tax=Nakamurella antarctica TaxID=1902245 RepID=A0A3G8ZUF7_9ACTN|nr:hypothetical protein EH165_05305 [Nakamurella antarctica]